MFPVESPSLGNSVAVVAVRQDCAAISIAASTPDERVPNARRILTAWEDAIGRLAVPTTSVRAEPSARCAERLSRDHPSAHNMCLFAQTVVFLPSATDRRNSETVGLAAFDAVKIGDEEEVTSLSERPAKSVAGSAIRHSSAVLHRSRGFRRLGAP